MSQILGSVYVIQITHANGISFWNGATPQNDGDNINGWGALQRAIKYKTKESAERDALNIKISWRTECWGYDSGSLKVTEITDGTKSD